MLTTLLWRAPYEEVFFRFYSLWTAKSWSEKLTLFVWHFFLSCQFKWSHHSPRWIFIQLLETAKHSRKVRHYRKKNNHEKRARWYPQMTQDKSRLRIELGTWRREGAAPFAGPKTQAESWRNPFCVMKTLSRHLFWWCFFLHPLHFHMRWYYCRLLGSDRESPYLWRALHFPFVLSQPLWIVSFGTWALA